MKAHCYKRQVMRRATVSSDTYALYHADCMSVLDIITREVSLVTDPPYGIGLSTTYKSNQRSSLATCNDFSPIEGDDKPFDPCPFLHYADVVLFGANYFSTNLPASSGWIVWDKLDGLKSNRELGFNDNSDCELIWTNKDTPTRIMAHRWMGVMKASEKTSRRVHPTQKPVELMRQIIRHYTTTNIIFDPFMGSGTTGVAALLEGKQFVGVELSSDYFEIARARVSNAAGEFMQSPSELATGQLPLF